MFQLTTRPYMPIIEMRLEQVIYGVFSEGSRREFDRFIGPAMDASPSHAFCMVVL